MARKVEAVLAWLSATPGAGPTPASEEFGKHIRALLEGRFAASELTLVEHPNNRATKARVLASLKAAATNLKGSQDALLVVAFSGHGVALTEDAFAWVLSDGRLPEEELRQALQSMPSGAEVVLVMDCCYALRALPWSRGSKLQQQPPPAVDGSEAASRNVICVASARELLLRKNTKANYFARSLRRVVESSLPATYELLGDEMMATMEALGEVDWIPESWWVVCQPTEAGVLSPFRQ